MNPEERKAELLSLIEKDEGPLPLNVQDYIFRLWKAGVTSDQHRCMAACILDNPLTVEPSMYKRMLEINCGLQVLEERVQFPDLSSEFDAKGPWMDGFREIASKFLHA